MGELELLMGRLPQNRGHRDVLVFQKATEKDLVWEKGGLVSIISGIGMWATES